MKAAGELARAHAVVVDIRDGLAPSVQSGTRTLTSQDHRHCVRDAPKRLGILPMKPGATIQGYTSWFLSRI